MNDKPKPTPPPQPQPIPLEPDTNFKSGDKPEHSRPETGQKATNDPSKENRS